MNDWFEAEQRIERAQQLFESHRWEEALAEIDVALSINADNGVWHAQRGFILEELQQWDEAALAFRNALKLEPGDSDVALALGGALTRLGRFSEAIEVLEELSKTHSDLEPAYCHRIGIYAELGQHDKAEEMFYIAQELDEDCPRCFFHLGGSLAARGQHDRAIYCWDRVVELDPDCIGVNRRIAQSYRSQGDAVKARDYYLRELRDDPGNTDLLFELAELALESGDTAAAAAKFGQVLELEPDHVEARFMLGKIWLIHGQAGQALACFEAAQTLSDRDLGLPDFDLRVGEALFRLARFREARQRLEVALEKNPQNAAAAHLMGDASLAMSKIAQAGDAYRRVLAIDAKDSAAHHKLAVCQIRLAQTGSALQHCLEAVRLKPDFVAAMHTAVLAHLQLANWRDAKSMAHTALTHEPANADLQRLLRQVWRYRLRYYLRRVVNLFKKA